MSQAWRKTKQTLLPQDHQLRPGQYDLYPAFSLEQPIERGFKELARQLSQHQRLVIDGYGGVFWEQFRRELDKGLKALGCEAD